MMKARRNTRKRGGEQSRVSQGDRSAHVTRYAGRRKRTSADRDGLPWGVWRGEVRRYARGLFHSSTHKSGSALHFFFTSITLTGWMSPECRIFSWWRFKYAFVFFALPGKQKNKRKQVNRAQLIVLLWLLLSDSSGCLIV